MQYEKKCEHVFEADYTMITPDPKAAVSVKHKDCDVAGI